MALALVDAHVQGISDFTYSIGAGADRLLIIVLHCSNPANWASSISWGAKALTQFGTNSPHYDGTVADQRVNAWYLKEADIALGGSDNIIIGTMTGGGLGIFLFTGADQATPINELVHAGSNVFTTPASQSFDFSNSSRTADIIICSAGTGAWGVGVATFGGVAAASEVGNAGGAFYVPSTGIGNTYVLSDYADGGGGAGPIVALGCIAMSVNGGGAGGNVSVRSTTRRLRQVFIP